MLQRLAMELTAYPEMSLGKENKNEGRRGEEGGEEEKEERRGKEEGRREGNRRREGEEKKNL